MNVRVSSLEQMEKKDLTPYLPIFWPHDAKRQIKQAEETNKEKRELLSKATSIIEMIPVLDELEKQSSNLNSLIDGAEQGENSLKLNIKAVVGKLTSSLEKLKDMSDIKTLSGTELDNLKISVQSIKNIQECCPSKDKDSLDFLNLITIYCEELMILILKIEKLMGDYGDWKTQEKTQDFMVTLFAMRNTE